MLTLALLATMLLLSPRDERFVASMLCDTEMFLAAADDFRKVLLLLLLLLLYLLLSAP